MSTCTSTRVRPESLPGLAEGRQGDERHQAGPAWWQARDGRWCSPELHPGSAASLAASLPWHEAPGSPVDARSACPGWWVASDGNWYPPETHPNATGHVALTEPGVVESEGWVADPLGVHEYRYFNRGRPTNLVRDGTQVSYEEQPIGRAVGVPPGRPVDPQIRPASSGPRVGEFTPPLVVDGVLVGPFVLRDGPSPVRSACSLLSTAQARALLDNPPSVRRSDFRGSPKSGASVCTFIPWPIDSQRSFPSVFLTLGPAPSEFPSAIVRKVGTLVQVDGETHGGSPIMHR